MSNTTTDSNSNAIGVPPCTSVTVSTVTLDIVGNSSHKVFVTGQLSADCSGATGGIVVASILVDSNLSLNTQINNLEGDSGTILCLSGVVSLTPGKHQMDLSAFAENLQLVSAHHRLLSVVDLDAAARSNFVDVTDPRFGARGDGVTNDRDAIQAAIESLPPTGGTIYFPLLNFAPTTYLIGESNVLTPPLKYHSNTTFLGDHLPGIGRSTLKLCDDFLQLGFGLMPAPNSSWAQTIFAPASAGAFYGAAAAATDPSQNNVAWRSLKLDGNRDHQPKIFTPSNHGLVSDPVDTLNGVSTLGASTLLAGRYLFFVTYADVNGVETNVKQGCGDPVAVTDGHFVRLTLPPTPAGAQQLVVYVAKTTDLDAYGNVVFERRAPVAIPDGGTLDVTSHMAGVLFPPGYGIKVVPGEGIAGILFMSSLAGFETSAAISDGLTIDDCEVCFTAGDGVTCTGRLSNVTVTNSLIHDNGNNPMATETDSILNLTVSDSDFANGSTFDFENDHADHIRFRNCTFNGMGVGLNIGASPDPIINRDFLIDSCKFGNLSKNYHNLLVVTNTYGGRADGVFIKNCYFTQSTGAPVGVNALGVGAFENCIFDQSAVFQPGVCLAIDGPQILFDGQYGGARSWSVVNCSFKPYADGAKATTFPGIDAINGASVSVRGCTQLSNTDQGGPLPLNILFNAPVGGLANSRFFGNVGVLGEAKVAFVGYVVGAMETSLAVTFPAAQVTAQYEVCPTFGWDAGNWWVTGKNTDGYTLHWKNAPGGTTQLPITVRDAVA